MYFLISFLPIYLFQYVEASLVVADASATICVSQEWPI